MNVELDRSYEDMAWRDVRIYIRLDDGTEYCRTVMYDRQYNQIEESPWFYSCSTDASFDTVEPDDVSDEVKAVYDQHVAVAKVMARGDDP